MRGFHMGVSQRAVVSVTCPHCKSNNGNYLFSCRGCKVRFLMSLPTLQLRRGWLQRWQNKYGEDETEAVKAELSAQFEAKCK